MDFRSMLFPQQLDVYSPSMKSSELPFELGLQHIGIAHGTPMIRTGSIDGAVPAFGHQLPTIAKEPQQGSLYCSPSFGQGYSAWPNSCATVDENGSPCANTFEKKVPFTSKQFLVFDHSGDKTTLIYSSDIGASPFCSESFNLKPPPVERHSHNILKRKFETSIGSLYNSGPNLTYEENDDGWLQPVGGSEMREDSEEIDALLYSDGEDDVDYNKDSNDGIGDDDDEVTSTGHSPATAMADYRDVEKAGYWFDDQAMVEEVASSFGGPSKRVKGSHGDSDIRTPLTDHTGSGKTDVKLSSSEYEEDDAESLCGDWKSVDHDDDDDETGCGFSQDLKGLRKERIREAVSVLQHIVPGGKGKDTISVIDEAIHYLRYLKVNAKTLGLS